MKSFSNKLFAYLFICFLLVSHIPLNFAFSGAGAGNSGDPYQINSCDLLNETRDELDAYYDLNDSFSCDVSPYNTGEGFEPIGDDSTAFSGTFDGNNKTIDGLYINRPSSEKVGLIGYSFGQGGKSIDNVYLTNVNITGSNMVGALVGYAPFTQIDNCYVNGGIVKGENSVGGLIGSVPYQNYVDNSWANVSVSGTNYVGGLVGSVENGQGINHSYSLGSVTGTGDKVGGLVGYMTGASVDKSYATGDINGDEEVGGLVGYMTGASVNNSYATGNIKGVNNVAGLVGFGYSDVKIDNSYSTGIVNGTGNAIGGLTSDFYDGDSYVKNSFTTSKVYGGDMVYGFAYYSNTVDNVYWVNHSEDDAGNCYNGGDTGCTAKTDVTWFYNIANAPMDVWDFVSTWLKRISNFPVLLGQEKENPQIQFVSPSTETGNYSQNYIEANITATDDISIDTINLTLWNSTGLIQSNTSQTSPLFINFTNLSDGTYYLNATANDTFGNTNQTETRTILIDNTAPTISIINPTSSEDEKTQPTEFYVNISEDGVCEYSVDSGDRQSMTTSDDRLFHAEEVLSNGDHNLIYYCEDTVGNSDSSALILFDVAISSTGGSSSSTTPITLHHLEFEYEEWITNQENILIVKSLDNSESPVEINTLDSSILESIQVSGKDITRLDVGEFEVRYFLKEQDLDFVYMDITAKQGTKEIKESIKISVRGQTTSEEFKNNLDNKLTNLSDWIKENETASAIILSSIIILVFYLSYAMHKKK